MPRIRAAWARAAFRDVHPVRVSESDPHCDASPSFISENAEDPGVLGEEQRAVGQDGDLTLDRSEQPYLSRSVRLCTPAQFEEVKTLVNLLSERSDLPPADRDKLTAFLADLQQTVREDRRRAAGTARLTEASN